MTKLHSSVASRRAGRLVAVAALAVGPTLAMAQTYTWVPPSGNFSAPGKWTPSAPPASGSNTSSLVFPGSASYTANNDYGNFLLNGATFTHTTGLVTISGNQLEFAGTSPFVSVAGTGSALISANVKLDVNTRIVTTGTGSVTFGGTITSAPTIGLIKSGIGTAVFANPGVDAPSGSTFGYLAANGGTSTITGGYTVLTSTAAGSLNGTSAPTTVALGIGNASGQTAVVNINGGAQVHVNNVFAGNATGSTGYLNISGAGTTVTQDLYDPNAGVAAFTTGRFGIYDGTGYITVSDGAVVTGVALENRGAGSTGTITFTGAGTAGTFGQSIVGRTTNSNVTLVVSNGATFTSAEDLNTTGGGQLIFGSNESLNTTGNLIVDNATVNVSTAFVAFGEGTNSHSFVSMSHSATLTTTELDMAVDAGSQANVTLSTGAAFNIDYGVWGTGTGSNTTITVNGGAINASGLSGYSALGDAYGSTDSTNSHATLTVSGAGSATFSGGFEIGCNFFLDEGVASTGQTAACTVTGTGSTLAVTDFLIMAIQAGINSSLTVSSGASVTVAGDAYFGYAVGGAATVTLTGSTLTATNLFLGAAVDDNNFIILGGAAQLSLSNATATVTNGLYLSPTGTISLTGSSTMHAGYSSFADDGTTLASGSLTIGAGSLFTYDQTQTDTTDSFTGQSISGAGTYEVAEAGLNHYILAGAQTLTGTFRARNGGALIFGVPYIPATAGTGTLEAIGTDSAIVFDTTTTDNATGSLVARVHTVRATGGGQVYLTTFSRDNHLPQQLLITDTIDLGPAGAPTGLLDLGNNDLVVKQSTLSAVTSLISAFFTGSKTVGIGATAAQDATSTDPRDAIATLGVILNTDGKGGALYSTFDGQAVVATDVLVKYTYIGDTDLNGIVNAADLANLMTGLHGHLTGWVNGDLNYDGVINNADLTLLLTSLRLEGAAFGEDGGEGGSVPEPGILAPLALAVPMLGRRRR